MTSQSINSAIQESIVMFGFETFKNQPFKTFILTIFVNRLRKIHIHVFTLKNRFRLSLFVLELDTDLTEKMC